MRPHLISDKGGRHWNDQFCQCSVPWKVALFLENSNKLLRIDSLFWQQVAWPLHRGYLGDWVVGYIYLTVS